MVSINFSTREVNCKIVYYGPGLSGKTTNLQYVHTKVPKARRGDLISLATEADRTLYFDFLPIDIGSINGMATKFQLYTVPGQVFYNATRKLVLRGADGVVFVADSQRSKRDENIESLHNLKENLAEYGYEITKMPVVLQYNKRDLPDLLTIEELEADLNWGEWKYFEACASEGTGVFDTLKHITKVVLERAKKGDTTASSDPIPVGATVGATEETKVAMTTVVGKPAETEPEKEVEPVASDEAEDESTSESEETDALVERVVMTDTGKVATPGQVAEPDLSDSQRLAAQHNQGFEEPAVVPASRTEPISVGGGSSTAVAEAPVPAVQQEFQTESEDEQDSDEALPSADYADTFEVPRVISMQKSLRVKRKSEKRFTLFGWLKNLFTRSED